MRKRTHEIKVRLDDKEFDHLNKMVAKTLYNRETFLRLLIGGYTVQEVPRDYIMFHMDMVNACSGLYQAAKYNSSLSEAEKAHLFDIADQLSSVIAVMKSIYRPYYKERKTKK